MSTSSLVRGDQVYYKGKIYWFQPNGSSCYLYENEVDIGYPSRKVFAPRKTSVTKYISSYISCNDTISILSNKSPSMHHDFSCELKPTDVKKSFEYVYFGKDITDSRHLYKIGRTSNLENRLKHYKKGQPSFEFIIKIKTYNSVKLETYLKNILSKYVDKESSETFIIKINNLKKLLKKLGYFFNEDGIYLDLNS